MLIVKQNRSKNLNQTIRHPGDLDELEGKQSFINWASTTSTTWMQANQARMKKLWPHRTPKHGYKP